MLPVPEIVSFPLLSSVHVRFSPQVPLVSAALAASAERSSWGVPCDSEQTERAAAAKMLRMRLCVCFIVTSFVLGLASVLITNHFYYN